MEINHWAKLVKSGLVKAELENPQSDLLIIGHYGGFSTYKQDAWSGYAMKISDFVAEVSGITDILAGPGILITGTGPIRTVSIDGTFGGGTNFNVQPSGLIQVSKNTDPLDGNLINISNLDTLNIDAISIPSGLNWAAQWNPATTYAQDDVVWYVDEDTDTYYTYWAYNGTVPAGSLLPTAGQASNTYWARLGLEGPAGNPGYSTAIMKLYQWSTTQPTVFPSDQSAYTWDDGSFTLPSDVGLWSATIPSSPVEGETLWEISKQYTAYPIGTTEAIAWAGSGPAKAIAYFGETGTNGKSVLSGSGAPLNTLGEDGDFYIDTNSAEYTMYGPKALGSWTTNPTKDLKGDNGQDGSITYSGTGAPPNGTGVAGDYYIQTDSPNYTMFGPKIVDGNWTGVTSINLKGPQGAQGPAGQAVSVGFRTITQTSPAPDFKIKLGTTGSDLGKVLQCETGTSPMIILIPLSTSTGSGSTEFPVGAQVLLSRNGVGSLQIQPESGSGVTIRSADGMTYLRSTYSMATLMKLDNTTWYLVGDISPY